MDAVGASGDFELASHLEAFAVKADDVQRVINHALRQQGFAIMAPGHALRPRSDVNLCNLCQRGSIDAENDELSVIVVERMAFDPCEYVVCAGLCARRKENC